ncbi:MAG TPA: TPM domain-containing protein [Chitinophagaceae bacterium]|jgi:uncharacterized protein|nr:TPM domain-containing protein [Chitinophagaceae bacterium]
MRKILFIACLLFSIGAEAQVENAVPSQPNPPRLYNDFTKGRNFLTTEQASYLEGKLVAYDDSTSNQVAIVIVETLQGYSANEYATALGRKWGVGGREHNNGVVVLISTEKDNRDAYIAVGYGLEGVIPDVTAKHILEEELIPDFKEGNYYSGLNSTVDALMKAAAGEYTAPEGYGRRGKGIGIGRIILIFFIIWIILGVVGRGGKGGGGYASRRGWLGPTIFGGGLGSGGWGGGGWSGGGGGGGGFGGFGGGGFGGGGAGGRW